MLRALDEYVIGGIKTNISLFRRILRDEDFRAARIDTGYLERLLAGLACRRICGRMVPEDVVAVAAALFAAAGRRRSWLRECCRGEPVGRWLGGGRDCERDGLAGDWRAGSGGWSCRRMLVRGGGAVECVVDGRAIVVDVAERSRG